MKYFIFAMFFVCSATILYAQDFFIPDGALPVVRDELKPLDKTLQNRASKYSQRRYKIIDGRVFAVEDEPQIVPEETPSESLRKSVAVEATPTEQVTLPVASVETQPQPEPEPQNIILPPKVAAVDNKLPSYKNRYSFYLSDLQTFQKTGKMPANSDLENALKKLSSPRKDVLFDAVVQ